jgi:cell division septum initiation protein DivIVA
MLARARHERRRGGREPSSDTQGEMNPQPADNETSGRAGDATGAVPQDNGESEAGLPQSVTGHGAPASSERPEEADNATDAERPPEPIKGQLDRLATQIHGLQQQLDAFIARRNEAVAERASQHVASIVAAAEKAASEIRAGAEKDAVAIRERAMAEVQAEVQRIRSEAQADAARIRTDAHAQAARARKKAIVEASAEIQTVCARVSEELQTAATRAIAGIVPGTTTASPARKLEPTATPEPSAQVAAAAPAKRITDEVAEAVDELQSAALVLEQSLQGLRTIGDEQRPPG